MSVNQSHPHPATGSSDLRGGRRASVLVLVVGVLALMAIIVLVYSTIGQGDRRGSAALSDNTRLNDQSTSIGNYLAAVVGDDALATWRTRDLVGPGNSTNEMQDRVYRRTWTMPGVDPEVRSQAGNRPWRQFNPTGSVVVPWLVNGGNEPAPYGPGADPRSGFSPWLASTEPTSLNVLGEVPPDFTKGFLDRVDLKSISNFAPDGRAINKATLRGNLAAESGFGSPAANSPLQTSSVLSLLVPSPGATTRQQRLDPSNWLPTSKLPDRQTNADLNTPAHWFTDQEGAFRPVVDKRFSAGSVLNFANQWGDPVGDGLARGRWFEFVDVSDPTAPRSVIPTGGPLRLIACAYAMDLSGLVNVNTALSFDQPTSAQYPPGLRPSDVDLERLLSMRVIYGSPNQQSPGYGAYRQPTGNLPANYSTYDNPNVYQQVGDSAFASLLYARLAGAPPARDQFFAPGQVPAGAFPRGVITEQDRAELYDLIGRDPTGATFTPRSNSAIMTFASPFSISDELELRAYQSLNDPTRTSRLEQTLDARNAQQPNMGPMRSNRDLELERSATRTWSDALLMNATSVRSFITTVSSQRPLFSSPASPLLIEDVSAMNTQPGYNAAARVAATPRALSDAEIRPDLTLLLESLAMIPAAVRTTAGATPPQNAEESQSLDRLFHIYADSLAPDSGAHIGTAQTDAWNSNNVRAQVLHYGFRHDRTGPGGSATPTSSTAETAVRLAAHMALNLIDGRDVSDKPSEMTLLMDKQFRAQVPRTDLNTDSQLDFPAWPATTSDAWVRRGQSTGSTMEPRLLGKLDLGDSRISPDTTNTSTPPAMNLFGIKAQPFITQAAALVMYTDAPQQAGGDMDWKVIPGQPPQLDRSKMITINGTRSDTNRDFLVEVVAFQLHNPFDRKISLSLATDTSNPASPTYGQVPADGQPMVDGASPQYYFEFAGKFYALVEDHGPTQPATSVSLDAYQTKVFYVLADEPEDILARWKRVWYNRSGAHVPDELTIDDVTKWINKQFTVGTTLPVRIMRVNPNTMARIDRRPTELSPSTLAQQAEYEGFYNNSPQMPDRLLGAQQVRLWRVVRHAGESPNRLTNDTLVDRLRDPGPTPTRPMTQSDRPTLDAGLPNGNNSITGAMGGVEPGFSPNPGNLPPEENTGYSITTWGCIRRPADPSAAGTAESIPVGALPAYLMEVKSSDTNSATGGRFSGVASLNARDRRLNSGEAPTPADFTTVRNGSRGYKYFYDSPGAALSPLGLLRSEQNRNLACPFTNDPPYKSDTARNPGNNLSGIKFGTQVAGLGQYYMQYHLAKRLTDAQINRGERLPPLRQADALLPLAIGPYELPLDSTGNASENNLDRRWTTLGEAIAMAMDYDSTADTNDAMYRIGAYLSSASPTPAVEGALDRGQLRLDAFTPYNDSNGNGRFDQFAGGPDPHRGNGIPLALNILDQFRVTRFGSLTGGMNGSINVNTAPRTVLSLLPLLTPDHTGWLTTTELAPGAGVNVFRPDQDVWDLAATLVAYRDRVATWARPAGSGAGGALAIDFRDDNVEEPNRTLYNGRFDTKGRRWGTGIAGIRQVNGFQSLGELLAARLADDARSLGNPAQPSAHPLSAFVNMRPEDRQTSGMDRLGRDTQKLDPRDQNPPQGPPTPNPNQPNQSMGLVTTLYHAPNGADPQNVSNLVDSYEQKLAIANAIMNTVSVRSDVFCVWFLVEGYLPSDVEGLAPYVPGVTSAPESNPEYQNPMVPTVKRRYMMVIDRSNVVQQGDKPRILLFEELPV